MSNISSILINESLTGSTGSAWKRVKGNFTVSIAPGAGSTVALQRRFGGGVTKTVKEYTAAAEEVDFEPSRDVEYRFVHTVVGAASAVILASDV